MTGPVGLTDLDLWARGVPYAEFARLRGDLGTIAFDPGCRWILRGA